MFLDLILKKKKKRVAFYVFQERFINIFDLRSLVDFLFLYLLIILTVITRVGCIKNEQSVCRPPSIYTDTNRRP